MQGCVESGKSVQEGGAKYTTAGMFITGAANLGDSLTAIEDLVYNKKKITMDELIKALDKNFEGEERMRQMLINEPPKYGNDDPHADAMVRDLLKFCADTVQEWETQEADITHSVICHRQ